MDYRGLAREILSQGRLAKYGSLNPSDLPKTFAHYLWNIGLCEALYPLLNCIEVSLRNRIHSAMENRFKRTRWFDPGSNILFKKDEDQVRSAINLLRREHKSPNAGRVIAALSLGFWVNLFSWKYEQRFWHGRFLRSVFPHAVRSQLAVHKIRPKLYRIKYLRNRVFHHESIYHWSQLDATYQDLKELSYWLSTDMHRVVSGMDRFEQIQREGFEPFQELLNG